MLVQLPKVKPLFKFIAIFKRAIKNPPNLAGKKNPPNTGGLKSLGGYSRELCSTKQFHCNTI